MVRGPYFVTSSQWEEAKGRTITNFCILITNVMIIFFVAAFIACSEQIQAAFRLYDEFKDHLQAKQLQQEENIRAHVDTLDDDIGSSDNDDDDDDAYNASVPGTSHHGGSSITDHHLRKSEQPLVWKLDPREDFKANKMKMKKRMDQAERERIEQERWQERKEALNIKTPGAVEIPPEVLVIDHPVQPVEEREQEELEYRRLKEEEISKALEPEDGAEVARLNPVAHVDADVEEEEEEEEEQLQAHELDAGELSDDSWEEVPDARVVGLSIENSAASSSSSSFLISSDTSPSRTPK